MTAKEIRNTVIIAILVWRATSVVADVVLELFYFKMYN